jgi:hypothetical protein
VEAAAAAAAAATGATYGVHSSDILLQLIAHRSTRSICVTSTSTTDVNKNTHLSIAGGVPRALLHTPTYKYSVALPVVDEACNVAPPGRVYAALEAAGARWKLNTHHLQGNKTTKTSLDSSEQHVAACIWSVAVCRHGSTVFTK